MRILVTDTTWAMQGLTLKLREAGFLVTKAADAGEAVEFARTGVHDAVAIDPDLPDMTAAALVRALRAQDARLPICLFARKWSETDRAACWRAGADHVAEYPVHGAAVAARLRAYARRARGLSAGAQVLGPLRLDLDTQSLRHGGTALHLTRKEYELMELLWLRRGDVVTREEIMTRLYAWQDEPDPKIIDVYICRIRARLAAIGAAPGLIATSISHGYRLDPWAAPAPAEASTDGPAEAQAQPLAA